MIRMKIEKLQEENTRQYQAICDFWRLGPGRNLNQLHIQYDVQENPPCKTYGTLRRWASDYNWENRIAQAISEDQELLENEYQERLLENARRRFDILEDMYSLANEIDIDTEMVSVAQATTLYKTFLDAVGKVFNVDAPDKIALTDPSGKEPYNQSDVQHLLELTEKYENRPKEK